MHVFVGVKIEQKAGQIRCIDPSGHTAKVASQRAGQAALRCWFVLESRKNKSPFISMATHGTQTLQ